MGDNIAKKTYSHSQEKNLFIHIKGLDLTSSEDDVRRFLADVSIVEFLMITVCRKRPTGAVYLKLQTELDTELAKRYNKMYLGRHIVFIEVVFEEHYNLAKQMEKICQFQFPGLNDCLTTKCSCLK